MALVNFLKLVSFRRVVDHWYLPVVSAQGVQFLLAF